MTDDSEHLWGIIRILERSCASRSERIDELEAENRDLRSALATIAEQNAGADSGSGWRAAEEPAGGDACVRLAPPPAAPEAGFEAVADRTLALLPASPTVCIGAETLRRLRTEGSVIVSGVALVAASDFPTDPTMPEEPSEAVVDAVLDWAANYGVEFPDDVETHVRDLLGAIRAALAKEQGR